MALPADADTRPANVKSLAERLGIESGALHAALESVSTPRCAAAEADGLDSLLLSKEMTCDSEEECAAAVCACLLGGGAVESLLLSVLSTASCLANAELKAEFDKSWNDTSQAKLSQSTSNKSKRATATSAQQNAAYTPSFPGTGDGECLVWHMLHREPLASYSPASSALAVCARTYYEHSTWQRLVESRTFAYSTAREGPSPSLRDRLNSELVHIENERQENKDNSSTERRRYQGTEKHVSAICRLESFPWEQHFNYSDGAETKPWSEFKHALTEHSAGHGMGPFLADKTIQGLLLSSILKKVGDGGDLGPGALTSLLCIVRLVRGKGWRSAYKLRPAEGNEHPEEFAGFDFEAFISKLRRLFPVYVCGYWAARLRAAPALCQLDGLLRGALDREHPFMLFEHMLCELLRRRAAGLAWARGVLKQLPKGTVTLQHHLAGAVFRTLESYCFLVFDGDAVRAAPLRHLCI